jgi:group I intron endonuclease
MQSVCGIYLLRNNVNGKVYVGQSVDICKRWYFHRLSANRGDKSPLYSAMRKYGINEFSVQVLEECEVTKLDEREAYWMDFYEARERGYNLMPAGQNGRVMDDAMRKWLSENSKKWKPTEEILEKMRAASTGKKHSEETKKKMSESSKNRWAKYRIDNPVIPKAKNPLGRSAPRSEAFSKKQSERMKNLSAEAKARHLEAMRIGYLKYRESKAQV